MIQILTNTGDIAQPWARRHLQSILKPGMKACILAMSDFEDVASQTDWLRDYGPGGIWHEAYERPLRSYGIDRIVWISPFVDDRKTMLEALESADLVILPGGAPERLMANLKKFRLKAAVKKAPILFGVSAGAMVQLDDYHISPDSDYPDFSWQKGLGLLPFDVECHYTKGRRNWVDRAIEEKHLPTYCLYEDGGLLVVDGKTTCMGNVDFASI